MLIEAFSFTATGLGVRGENRKALDLVTLVVLLPHSP